MKLSCLCLCVLFCTQECGSVGPICIREPFKHIASPLRLVIRTRLVWLDVLFPGLLFEFDAPLTCCLGLYSVLALARV